MVEKEKVSPSAEGSRGPGVWGSVAGGRWGPVEGGQQRGTGTVHGVWSPESELFPRGSVDETEFSSVWEEKKTVYGRTPQEKSYPPVTWRSVGT